MASSYIPGYINSMDVAGFGFNTQSAMFWQSQHAALDVHEGVQCDGCGASPLRGIRWKCQSCPDHDICNNCKKQNAFAGHPFQIMSMTSTNNANAMANGGQVVPEAMVHWTTCQKCGANPIRGTLYSCTVCPKFDLCDPCNKDRYLNHPDAHPHRFDFFVMPKPENPPPTMAGGPGGRPASFGPPPSQQQYGYPSHQQGYAPPPPPRYKDGSAHDEKKTQKVLNWLGKHLEMK